MNTRLEFCKEADIPELFGLFSDWYAFNPRMRERDYFDWQFKNTPIPPPDGQEYNFLVFRRGDVIEGCFGFVAFEFVHPGGRAVGAWSHNWQVAEHSPGGLPLLGGFTDLFDNRFYLRINEASGAILRLFRVPEVDRIARLVAFPDAPRAAEVFGITDTAERARLADSAARLAALPAAVAKAVDRIADGEEFGLGHWPDTDGWVCRTARYVNWRYRDIPRHDYRLLRSNTGLGVYRIEQIMHRSETVVRLLDWTFSADECPGALASLMEAVAPHRPVLIDFCCTHAGVRACLAALGFAEDATFTQPIPDLFRPMNRIGGFRIAVDLPPHRVQRSFPFERWYITTGESDIDRVKL